MSEPAARQSPSLGRSRLAAVALTAMCTGAVGVAVADAYSRMPAAEVREIANCKYQATVRGVDPSHKGTGMTAYARLRGDDTVEYSYRITKRGVRFYKALGYPDDSFDAVRVTVRRTSKTRGYFRNTIATGDDGDIRQITFCAK